jgi:hypothetical protein
METLPTAAECITGGQPIRPGVHPSFSVTVDLVRRASALRLAGGCFIRRPERISAAIIDASLAELLVELTSDPPCPG